MFWYVLKEAFNMLYENSIVFRSECNFVFHSPNTILMVLISQRGNEIITLLSRTAKSV